MSRIAHASKNINLFFNEGAKPAASGHATEYYLSASHSHIRWVLKRFEKPELAQIEAAMASLYCVLSKPYTIPKVYGVYHENTQTIFASIASVFPDFQDLKTYLSSGLSSEKLIFLIENGFAEICALSYFFEEDDLHKRNIGISYNQVVRIDFDMSAFAVIAGSDLHGSRSSLDSRRLAESFSITLKDIEHFPQLLDAKPYYFPGVFRFFASSDGYSAEEVRQFCELQHDARFVNRAYGMFLKIILLPDTVIQNIFSAHMGNTEQAAKLIAHFILRKNELREVLLQKNEFRKFRNFLERSSSDNIRSLFSEMEIHNIRNSAAPYLQIDMHRARTSFCRFIFDFVSVDLKNDLFRFLEITARLAENFSEENMNALKKLRETLLQLYQNIAEKNPLSSADMAEFIHHLKQNLIDMRNLFAPREQMPNDESIHSILNRLEMNCSALVFCEESQYVVCAQEFDVVDAAELPILNSQKLVLDTMRWLQSGDGQSPFIAVVKNALETIKQEQSTMVARVSSVIASVAISAASFFARASEGNTPDLISQLQTVVTAFDEDHDVFHAIFRIDWFTGAGSAVLKNQIIFHWIAEFVKAFSAKPAIEQMQIDPVLSGFLKAERFCVHPSAVADELIALFKKAVMPYVERFANQAAPALQGVAA